ncbi:MAG: alpha/beta fold hydrolase, partial [Betaproteobacteria bacterium]
MARCNHDCAGPVSSRSRRASPRSSRNGPDILKALASAPLQERRGRARLTDPFRPDSTVSQPTKLIFLPGASGDTRFWAPVASRLGHPAAHVHFGWPGFGPTPADPRVASFDDLVGRVVLAVDQPCALIAQSMGGVVALSVALRRPSLVTHLVLTATSGGLDVSSFGAQDWRPSFARAYPRVPDWFGALTLDLSARLPSIAVPTLLLWGDADPISPVTVGRRLQGLLPNAHL